MSDRMFRVLLEGDLRSAKTPLKPHRMKNDEQGNGPHERISVPAARKMLGMISKNYSDADIEEALRCLYAIAEEAFDEYEDQ